MDLLQYEAKYEKLRQRFDSDMKLALLEDFVMKDSKNNSMKEIFDNITSNEPLTYLDRSVAFMGTATRRWDITGIETRDQATLESQRKTLWKKNDSRLAAQGMEGMQFTTNYFSVARGWDTGIELVKTDGKLWLSEMQCLDPRWTMVEYDSRGPVWGCWRVRVGSEYLREAWDIVTGNTDDVEIYIRLTREDMECHLARLDGTGKIVGFDFKEDKKIHHGLGICPVHMHPAETRPRIINGPGSSAAIDLSYQGESIYSWNRKLYGKLNELVSVWATLNKMQVMSPLAYIGRRKNFTQMPFGIAAVVKLEEGEKIIELPTKEMNATAERLLQLLMVWIQKGSLPSTEFGEGFARASGTALTKLSDTRGTIFEPRFNLNKTYYEQASRNIRYQINKGGFKVGKIPEEMEDFCFEPEIKVWALKYAEDIKYSAKTPEQNVMLMSLADSAARNGVSKRTRFRDIMEFDNWKEEIAQADREALEEAFPEVKFRRLSDDLWSSGLTEDERKKKDAEWINWRLEKIWNGELPPIDNGAAKQGSQSAPGPSIAVPGGESNTGPGRAVSRQAQFRGIQTRKPNQEGNNGQ